MTEFFIYYRAAPDRAEQIRDAVARMHARLTTSHPALCARLLCRVEPEARHVTWMETYAMAGQAMLTDDVLSHIELEAATLAPLIDGLRHIERFRLCAS